MIPRNLPGLLRDAVTNGWDINVRCRYGPSFDVQLKRGTEAVHIEWWMTLKGFSIAESTINGISTPYAQCVRLIKEDQA